MSMSVGSSSDALSYLQSLLQSAANTAGNAAGVGPIGDLLTDAANGASQNAGGAAAGTQPFGPSPPPFSSGTMAALMALQGQGANGAGGSQGLFSQLDTDGDGSISKTEFESALNQSGDGSVSESELSSAAHHGHGHGHHHHMEAGGSGGGDQGLSALLNASGADGAKTQTATNSDGSSTTTITYADGSTVTMTTPAAQQNGGTSGDGTTSQTAGGSNSNNLIEQLIRLQAQLVSQQGASVSAVA